MNIETTTKINSLIQPAKQIAIILPELLSVDHVCTAMALSLHLKQQSKFVQIFSSSKDVPPLGFLSEKPAITSNFGNSAEFTIKVLSRNAKPKQLRYEKDNDDLLIYITPESGKFGEQDIELLPASQDFDLLIMIGVSSMESLGELYSKNSELFYQSTKIAINNNIEQEYYAALTWVEASSASISEQIGAWLEQDKHVTSETMATLLLAGIIDQTQSFRDPKTTPHTLDMASELVTLGARQQDIIQHLFKTKPFSLLQLWGRAMARVKVAKENQLLYSVITKQDFEKTETSIQLLPQVLKELIGMANNYQLVMLVAELDQGVKVMVAGLPHVRLKTLLKLLDPNIIAESEKLLGNYSVLSCELPHMSIDNTENIVSTLSSGI